MHNRIKLALIGPGRMGVNYAKVVKQNPFSELVAICGNSTETTDKNGKQFNVPLYYENNWNQMFIDFPDIDTVIIATSEWAHLSPFTDAVKAGKNIIIEKPLAVSPDDIREMKKLKNEHPQLKIMVCLTCRFDNRYVLGKKMLDEKQLGNIGYIYSRRNADYKTASRIIGKFPIPYWITVHDIDLMRWYLNSEVKEIHAFNSHYSGKGDLLIVNLLFENGTRGVIETIFYGKPVTGQHHSRMDVEGENGKIELNIASAGAVQFLEHSTLLSDEHDFVDMYGKYVGSTPNMINHFIDVLVKNDILAVNFNDGIKSVEVCEAIHQSLINKQSVLI